MFAAGGLKNLAALLQDLLQAMSIANLNLLRKRYEDMGTTAYARRRQTFSFHDDYDGSNMFEGLPYFHAVEHTIYGDKTDVIVRVEGNSIIVMP